MSLRDELNNADPNRLADAFRLGPSIGLGDLLNKVIAGLTATETGVTPASNVATLANQPSSLFQVNVTAGTSTGVKKLKKGPITGPKAITPAAGECVWDGGKKVLFAAADGATAVSFTYATAADVTCSILSRVLGQSDTL